MAGRFLALPGCFLSAWGATAPPHHHHHHFTHPQPRQGGGAGEAGPGAQLRGQPSLPPSCHDPASQAAGWSGRAAGGSSGGGSWHTTFRVRSKVLTRNGAPGQERSLGPRDSCLMLCLFLLCCCRSINPPLWCCYRLESQTQPAQKGLKLLAPAEAICNNLPSLTASDGKISTFNNSAALAHIPDLEPPDRNLK